MKFKSLRNNFQTSLRKFLPIRSARNVHKPSDEEIYSEALRKLCPIGDARNVHEPLEEGIRFRRRTTKMSISQKREKYP